MVDMIYALVGQIMQYTKNYLIKLNLMRVKYDVCITWYVFAV